MVDVFDLNLENLANLTSCWHCVKHSSPNENFQAVMKIMLPNPYFKQFSFIIKRKSPLDNLECRYGCKLSWLRGHPIRFEGFHCDWSLNFLNLRNGICSEQLVEKVKFSLEATWINQLKDIHWFKRRGCIVHDRGEILDWWYLGIFPNFGSCINWDHVLPFFGWFLHTSPCPVISMCSLNLQWWFQPYAIFQIFCTNNLTPEFVRFFKYVPCDLCGEGFIEVGEFLES